MPDSIFGVYKTSSEEETKRLGEKLGNALKNGAVVCLTGDLGAGKTVFVKGAAAALGICEDEVSSPTFTILNVHQGKSFFYHFDVYRLESDEDAYGIGAEEYLCGDGISFVEWGEKISGVFPEGVVFVTIIKGAHMSDNEREIRISETACF